mmetsp:Transcript_87103/g.191374  ORF Transcript_87103/g.191374 Transcript_87103/m.191374 type:complete len:155 (-) Transcript_87103:959-1423(-)
MHLYRQQLVTQRSQETNTLVSLDTEAFIKEARRVLRPTSRFSLSLSLSLPLALTLSLALALCARACVYHGPPAHNTLPQAHAAKTVIKVAPPKATNKLRTLVVLSGVEMAGSNMSTSPIPNRVPAARHWKAAVHTDSKFVNIQPATIPTGAANE